MDKKYVHEQTFENTNYTASSLEKGEYEYCTFINCDFSGTDLADMRFLETKFIGCNFSNANLVNTSFQDATFEKCKMLGLRFEQCNNIGFSARFEECQLDHSTFFKLSLGQTSFSNSQLHEVDFTEAEMKSTKLINCDLLRANFERTNLEKADFSHSINYSIDPEMNRITGARFTLPNVIGLLDKYNIKVE